jgi:hypothetical protein
VLDITPAPHLLKVDPDDFFGIKFSWTVNNVTSKRLFVSSRTSNAYGTAGPIEHLSTEIVDQLAPLVVVVLLARANREHAKLVVRRLREWLNSSRALGCVKK